MTTTVTTASSGPLTANGVTPLPFTFQSNSETEIDVERNGVVVPKNTYFVTRNEDGTGSITPLSSWGSDTVYIHSAPDYKMFASFQRHGAFYPDTFNPHLNRMARSIIGLRGWIARQFAILQAQINSIATTGGTLVALNASGMATTDVTAAVQAAFTAAKASGKALFIPAATVGYRTTAPINVSGSVRIWGEGTEPFVGNPSSSVRGLGSWFFLDHTGVGFNIDNGGAFVSGIFFDQIGTYRPQPARVAGVPWTPFECDYDINIKNCDVTLKDVMTLNPTKAVRLQNGFAGRLTTIRLRGQPMRVGVEIEQSYDGYIAYDTRWWPYWSNTQEVHDFTLTTRRGLWLKHCDNPHIVGHFDIFSRFAVAFGSNDGGAGVGLRSTSRAEFFGLGIDQAGECGVFVEPGAADVTASFTGGWSLGFNGAAAAAVQQALEVNGTNARITYANHRFTYFSARVATVNGTGNVLRVDGPYAELWNRANNPEYTAFAAGTGNKIILNGEGIWGDGNGAAKINSPLLVSSDAVLVSNVVPVSTTGALGAGATCQITYNRRGEWVKGTAVIDIPANGTGAGVLQVSMPVPQLFGSEATAVGRATNVTGVALVASIAGGVMSIQKYDNTYAGANGIRLVVTFEYRVASL